MSMQASNYFQLYVMFNKLRVVDIKQFRWPVIQIQI